MRSRRSTSRTTTRWLSCLVPVSLLLLLLLPRTRSCSRVLACFGGAASAASKIQWQRLYLVDGRLVSWE